MTIEGKAYECSRVTLEKLDMWFKMVDITKLAVMVGKKLLRGVLGKHFNFKFNVLDGTESHMM